jgi:hypothetical protein
MVFAAKNKPCTDCRNSFPPEIMDLDHVRGEKLFSLCSMKSHSRKTKYRTYKQIEEEIAKCDPRCPTCHRLRHYYENLRKS